MKSFYEASTINWNLRSPHSNNFSDTGILKDVNRIYLFRKDKIFVRMNEIVGCAGVNEHVAHLLISYFCD